MKKISLSVLPLMAVLCGCQQAEPVQHVEPSAAAPALLAVSAVPAAAPMPAPVAAQPASPGKPENVAQPAPAVVQPVAVPKPAAAVAAAAKPEVKAEAVVLSDAEGRKLAQKNGCFACHAMDRKVVGPGWKDIAAKYRGQPNAEARLIDSVAKGSRGVWGSSPMPPNAPRVSAEDTRALVRFILSLK